MALLAFGRIEAGPTLHSLLGRDEDDPRVLETSTTIGSVEIATRAPSIDSFDRQARRLPFRIAVLKPMDEIAALPESRDRLEGEDAVWSSAIGDHFPAGR